MPAPVDRPVRFGVFEVSLYTGELRKAGVRIALGEQPFQVLKMLLERPGDLVTREELRHRLWPADTFVEYEQGLNAAVRRLREALGDSADAPRFVETLPRRGYRLIVPISGPIEHTGQTLPDGDIQQQPDVGAPSGRRTARLSRMWWRPVPVGLVFLAVAATLWQLGVLRSPPPNGAVSSDGPIRLAALPVRNLTGDAAQEHIADGMTEELITQLNAGAPSRLAVIATPSAMHYKNSTKRADEIGRELNVATSWYRVCAATAIRRWSRRSSWRSAAR